MREPIAEPSRTVTWNPSQVDPVVVAFHDRCAAVCEQYRALRARLISANTQRKPQVLAITSAIPEEGKSVTTVNLGLIMAEGGEHRILIADGDFRRSAMARMLGIPGALGLADVLRGQAPLEAALQPTPLPNLRVLPAGTVADNNYGEPLAGPRAQVTLARLRSAFDYVLIDTPPVTTVSDVCLLGPHCDGALLVVQMCRTPEPVAQQAVRTLQANGIKVIGALLSRFDERVAGYYERYYYSSDDYRGRAVRRPARGRRTLHRGAPLAPAAARIAP
ncbi:MAG: CpsD/CapB family tyrosine-protein kinase [Planctomycetota bacterium]